MGCDDELLVRTSAATAPPPALTRVEGVLQQGGHVLDVDSGRYLHDADVIAHVRRAKIAEPMKKMPAPKP